MATPIYIPGTSTSLWSPSTDVAIFGNKPFVDPEQMRRDFDTTTPTVVVDTRQPSTAAPTKVDPLAAAREYDAMIARRNEAARQAVLAKIFEQQQQGVVPYTPENPEAVDEELRRRLAVTSDGQARAVPGPMFTGSVQTLQQRPTGGVIADYGGGNRVVTSRYGTGYATTRPRKGEAIIEGKPASQWFQNAANRQNTVIDMGVGKELYIPEQRAAEFAEGTRKLKEIEQKSAQELLDKTVKNAQRKARA
jgi:hypothetical protein